MDLKQIILDIGTKVPIDQKAGFRAFICASSGYGKSYLAGKLIEELLEKGFLVAIFDIEGEYHTLREKYDLLIIGRDIDFIVDPSIVNVYTDLLLKQGVSVVFDFSAGKLGKSDFEAQQFFKMFGERLFMLERQMKRPVILVMEEAEVFAPQQGRAVSLNIANIIAKRGRKHGIHSIWISQRPASINKNILSQCNIIFAGRVTHETDLKALEDYVGKENLKIIQKLEPQQKIMVQEGKAEIFTVAPRKTRHGADTPITPLDQKSPQLSKVAEKLGKMIAERIQEQEQEKDKLQKLRAEVKRLTEELELRNKRIEELETILKTKETIVSSLEIKTKPIMHTAITTGEIKEVATYSDRRQIIRELPRYEQKIIEFLEGHRFEWFTLRELARRVGYSGKSRRYKKAIELLRKHDLIKTKREFGRIRVQINQ